MTTATALIIAIGEPRTPPLSPAARVRVRLARLGWTTADLGAALAGQASELKPRPRLAVERDIARLDAGKLARTKVAALTTALGLNSDALDAGAGVGQLGSAPTRWLKPRKGAVAAGACAAWPEKPAAPDSPAIRLAVACAARATSTAAVATAAGLDPRRLGEALAVLGAHAAGGDPASSDFDRIEGEIAAALAVAAGVADALGLPGDSMLRGAWTRVIDPAAAAAAGAADCEWRSGASARRDAAAVAEALADADSDGAMRIATMPAGPLGDRIAIRVAALGWSGWALMDRLSMAAGAPQTDAARRASLRAALAAAAVEPAARDALAGLLWLDPALLADAPITRAELRVLRAPLDSVAAADAAAWVAAARALPGTVHAGEAAADALADALAPASPMWTPPVRVMEPAADSPVARLRAVRNAARLGDDPIELPTPRGDSMARRVRRRLEALGADLAEIAQFVSAREPARERPPVGDPCTAAELVAAIALADADPAVAPLVAELLGDALIVNAASLLRGGPVDGIETAGLAAWLDERVDRDDAAFALVRPAGAPRPGRELAALLEERPGDARRTRIGVRRGDKSSMAARVAARMADVGVDLPALAARVAVLAGPVAPGALARLIAACPAVDPRALVPDPPCGGERDYSAEAASDRAMFEALPWDELGALLEWVLDGHAASLELAGDGDGLLPWGAPLPPLPRFEAARVRATSPWPGAARAARRIVAIRRGGMPQIPGLERPSPWPEDWRPRWDDLTAPAEWPAGEFCDRVRAVAEAAGIDLPTLADRVGAVIGAPTTAAAVADQLDRASGCFEGWGREDEIGGGIAAVIAEAIGVPGSGPWLASGPLPVAPAGAIDAAIWRIRARGANGAALAAARQAAACAGVADPTAGELAIVAWGQRDAAAGVPGGTAWNSPGELAALRRRRGLDTAGAAEDEDAGAGFGAVIEPPTA